MSHKKPIADYQPLFSAQWSFEPPSAHELNHCIWTATGCVDRRGLALALEACVSLLLPLLKKRLNSQSARKRNGFQLFEQHVCSSRRATFLSSVWTSLHRLNGIFERHRQRDWRRIGGRKFLGPAGTFGPCLACLSGKPHHNKTSKCRPFTMDFPSDRAKITFTLAGAESNSEESKNVPSTIPLGASLVGRQPGDSTLITRSPMGDADWREV